VIEFLQVGTSRANMTRIHSLLLKSFANAAITIAGIELAHGIQKGQFSFGHGRRRRGWSRKAKWAMALA